MNDKLNYWIPVLNNLEINYPNIFSKLVNWYPTGRNEITVATEDDELYSYHYLSNRIYKLKDFDNEKVDEHKWRQEFSERLNLRMTEICIPRWKLSQLTSISEVTISKYMNGKATPSTYNLSKIARALKCSISELGDI